MTDEDRILGLMNRRRVLVSMLVHELHELKALKRGWTFIFRLNRIRHSEQCIDTLVRLLDENQLTLSDEYRARLQ